MIHRHVRSHGFHISRLTKRRDCTCFIVLADICDLKTLAEVVGPDKDKIEGARSDRQGLVAGNGSSDRDQGCRDGDRAIRLLS